MRVIFKVAAQAGGFSKEWQSERIVMEAGPNSMVRELWIGPLLEDLMIDQEFA